MAVRTPRKPKAPAVAVKPAKKIVVKVDDEEKKEFWKNAYLSAVGGASATKLRPNEVHAYASDCAMFAVYQLNELNKIIASYDDAEEDENDFTRSKRKRDSEDEEDE
jgi:hypothetical protein